jgi:hypothetical protein
LLLNIPGCHAGVAYLIITELMLASICGLRFLNLAVVELNSTEFNLPFATEKIRLLIILLSGVSG